MAVTSVSRPASRVHGGSTAPAAPDPDRLNAFVMKMVGDLGAVMGAPLVLLGDKLGLFRALATRGPCTVDDVAEATRVRPRYVREWLCAQAAAGYIDYDAGADTFSMSPEQCAVFADPDSPVFMPGAFEVAAASIYDLDKVQRAFTNGTGLGWHEHHPSLFRGTERFFRPGYAANLVGGWLPALGDIVARLEAGIAVADVGCGHGATTVLMAQAYPRSRFHGFDAHDGSIATARQRAHDAGVDDRVRFEQAAAKSFPGGDYGLVTFFDCLHDMGDPVGAARHVRSALADDGTWMIVEPFAGDTLQQNLNPVGRVYYAASTMICTPCSLSQEVGMALGAQAGERRLREVVSEGGFGQFRRAAETPFNLVFEARP